MTETDFEKWSKNNAYKGDFARLDVNDEWIALTNADLIAVDDLLDNFSVQSQREKDKDMLDLIIFIESYMGENLGLYKDILDLWKTKRGDSK